MACLQEPVTPTPTGGGGTNPYYVDDDAACCDLIYEAYGNVVGVTALGRSRSSFGFSLPLVTTPPLGALSYLGGYVIDTLAATVKRRGQGETPSAEGVGWSLNPLGLGIPPGHEWWLLKVVHCA